MGDVSLTCDPSRSTRSIGFRVAHAAMRRDAERLVRAVRRSIGPRDAAAILAWFDHFAAMLARRQAEEDEIWLPMVVAAVDGFAATWAALTVEHERVSHQVGRTRQALAELAAARPPERTLRRQRATGAATLLRQEIEAHLLAEEAAVFPMLAAVADDVYAAAERSVARRVDVRGARVVLPWALDELDRRQPALLDEAWPHVPRLTRLVAKRRCRDYRRSFTDFFELAG